MSTHNILFCGEILSTMPQNSSLISMLMPNLKKICQKILKVEIGNEGGHRESTNDIADFF